MKYKIMKMEQSDNYWINIDIQPIVKEAAFGQLVALRVSGTIATRTMKDILSEIDAWLNANDKYLKSYIRGTTEFIKVKIGICDNIAKGVMSSESI